MINDFLDIIYQNLKIDHSRVVELVAYKDS